MCLIFGCVFYEKIRSIIFGRVLYTENDDMCFFSGIMGEVYVDSIGDRIADYSLLDMQDLEAGTFNVSHPHHELTTFTCTLYM